MTHTINRIFLDSSIFVEAFKENHVSFFHDITQSDLLECFISDIVCSEYWYQVLGLLGKKSPLTIKRQGEIGSLICKTQKFSGFLQIILSFRLFQTLYQLRLT